MSAKFNTPNRKENGRSLKTVFRLLYTYQVFISTPTLDLSRLNKAFFEHPKIGKGVTAETFRHYRQTLEAFGCTLSAHTLQGISHWALEAHPLELTLSQDEARVINLLFEHLHQSNVPKLEQALSHMTHVSGGPLLHKKQDLLTPIDTLAHRLLGYCLDGQILKIQCSNGQRLQIVPKQVTGSLGQVYFNGVTLPQRQALRINVRDILSVEQLAGKSDAQPATVTVTFRVTGRLAKNYRLHAGETQASQKDGSLSIQHSTQDVDSLLNRLLKYGPSCEVTAPQWVRNAIASKLAERLNTLQTAPPTPEDGAQQRNAQENHPSRGSHSPLMY